MRLTYRDNTVPHTNAKGELWEAYSDANYNEVINKLAAYEDTGLEPEEIKEKVGFMSPICIGCDGKTADGKRTRKCTYDKDFKKCLERSVHLSELAHAEEQGRLVILPCKVGDTFYYIAGTLRGNEYVASDAVAAIEISDTEPWIIDSCGCPHIEFWMSREDAKAALKGEPKDV